MDQFTRLVLGCIGTVIVAIATLWLIDGIFWTQVSPRALIIAPAVIVLAVGGVMVLTAVLTGDRAPRVRL